MVLNMNISEYFGFSKKKQDYTNRISSLKAQIKELEQALFDLQIEANHLTNTYHVPIKLVKTKSNRVFVAAWSFTTIRKECVTINHRYAIKVRDFARLPLEHKDSVLELFNNKDEAFLAEFLKIEKKRLSLNNATKIMEKIIIQLEQLANNDFPLKKIFEELKL